MVSATNAIFNERPVDMAPLLSALESAELFQELGGWPFLATSFRWVVALVSVEGGLELSMSGDAILVLQQIAQQDVGAKILWMSPHRALEQLPGLGSVPRRPRKMLIESGQGHFGTDPLETRILGVGIRFHRLL